MEELKFLDGFLRRDFSYGEAQRRKGEERVVKLRRRAFSSSNEAKRKRSKQKVLQRIFSEKRDVTKKSEERVVRLRGRTFRGTAKRFGKKPKQNAL